MDFENREDFLEVVHDFELLDDRVAELKNNFFEQQLPQVFVGTHSPITKSRHLSVIADSYDVNGEKFLLLAIGPIRMDYKKPLKVFKAIKDKNKLKNDPVRNSGRP